MDKLTAVALGGLALVGLCAVVAVGYEWIMLGIIIFVTLAGALI